MKPPKERLWACHEHEMIGPEEQAQRHAAERGCQPEELNQEVSDAVRAEWRKQATFFDPALAVTLAERLR